MRRKLGTAIAWVLVTLASILLATSAVSSVRNEVTDRPSPLRVTAATAAALPVASTRTPSDTVPPPSSSAGPSTSGVAPSPSSTLAPQTPTTAAPVTSSTAAPPASTTTTTTTSPDGEYFESYQLIGGWIRLRVTAEDVFLDGAVPAPGFTLRIKEDGPDQVKVEFESASHESKLQAEVGGSELHVETEEEPKD